MDVVLNESVFKKAAHALGRAVSEPDPQRALDILFRELLNMTGASTGRLFQLKASESTLACTIQLNRRDKPPKFPILSSESSKGRESLLKVFNKEDGPIIISDIESTPRSLYHSAGSKSRLIVPIMRGDECEGIIDIDSCRKQQFSMHHVSMVLLLVPVFLLLLERQNTLHLFRAIVQPIEFEQAFDDFLEALIILIADSSAMPYIVLRKSENSHALRCVAKFGFDGKGQNEEFDFDPLDDYPTFQKALRDNRPVVELSMDQPHLSVLARKKYAKEVKSFVAVPVTYGATHTYGVLSFGCPFVHAFSSLEIAGFVNIANVVAVSIANYNAFHARTSSLMDDAIAQATFSAVEISQIVRHEARNHIDTAKSIIFNQNARVKKSDLASKAKQELYKGFEDLDSTLTDISTSLDKIKAITKPPEEKVETVNVRKVVQGVIDMVQSRLNHLEIRAQITGGDIEVEGYRDLLQHAFLNLILNSIDAFRVQGGRGRKKIEIRIEPTSDKSNESVVTYTDNAGGINAFALKNIPDDLKDAKLNQILFAPGVTSKKEGSGWGLTLVRKMLQECNGSIDLVSHRNGIQFRIGFKTEE